MFNNSKYGNLLTVILVIAIIAIIGVVGIIGYRIFKAYSTDSGAAEAANRFEFTVNPENVIEQNTTKGEIASGNDNTATDNQKTTTYKGFEVVGTIQIPSINVKYPILEKLTTKSLETSVVLLYTSNGLNNVGNSVIIGHNYRNGTMFSDVKNLENGSIIYITDMQGRKVKYTVYNIYRASGSESSYMTRNTNGKREISLSTCTNDSKARTIVLARED